MDSSHKIMHLGMKQKLIKLSFKNTFWFVFVCRCFSLGKKTAKRKVVITNNLEKNTSYTHYFLIYNKLIFKCNCIVKNMINISLADMLSLNIRYILQEHIFLYKKKPKETLKYYTRKLT